MLEHAQAHSLPTCPFGRRARALTHCSGFSAATTLTFHWLGSQRSYGSRLLSGSACGPVVVLRAALNYPQPTVKVQATCLIAQPALCREAICHSRPSPGSLALKRGVRAALASAILSSLTLRAGRPVTPNPSLERTATGKPPWPRGAVCLSCASRPSRLTGVRPSAQTLGGTGNLVLDPTLASSRTPARLFVARA